MKSQEAEQLIATSLFEDMTIDLEQILSDVGSLKNTVKNGVEYEQVRAIEARIERFNLDTKTELLKFYKMFDDNKAKEDTELPTKNNESTPSDDVSAKSDADLVDGLLRIINESGPTVKKDE